MDWLPFSMTPGKDRGNLKLVARGLKSKENQPLANNSHEFGLFRPAGDKPKRLDRASRNIISQTTTAECLVGRRLRGESDRP